MYSTVVVGGSVYGTMAVGGVVYSTVVVGGGVQGFIQREGVPWDIPPKVQFSPPNGYRGELNTKSQRQVIVQDMKST